MQCLSEERLHGFHACELGEAEGEQVASHLALCPECAARDAALVRKHGRLVELVARALPAGLPPPASGAPTPPAGQPSGPAPVIPGYDVLREIYRGGQGIVYEAIQKSTHRRVAIKVMRDGPFAGPRDHARFEREVRILAQLNHPNIVTIHDSGVAGHCFYSVMDFVPGRPLDEYVRSEPAAGAAGPTAAAAGSDTTAACRGLTVGERIELFVKICEAVNSAHQLGVIHRDLKPGNILVRDDGWPFILDFGLAKATDELLARMTETTGSILARRDATHTGGTPLPHPHNVTQTGQFLGSLPWASPEQAQGNTQLDVRTDVYSLGVMLYQALTDRFPYPAAGSLTEILDHVCHRQPARPGSLRPDLNDEIDTIVLRCLAKERDRRYQSAGELGRDLSRYLRGEPIEAKRDSGFYVLRKTLKRHKAVTALSALLLLSLAIFSVAMGVQSLRLARSRDTAVVARNEAEQQRDHATREKLRADAESERNARLAYTSQIALAERHLEASSIGEMRRVLAETDPARRGWEWYRLSWFTDRSAKTFHVQDISTRALLTHEGRIIWGTSKGKVYCWDPNRARMVYRTVVDNAAARTLAMSEGDGILHVGTDHGRFTLRARTGEVLSRSDQHGVRALCPWPDNSKLLEISAPPGAQVSLIDPATGQVFFSRVVALIRTGDWPILACAPAGGHFAIATDGSAAMFNTKGTYWRSYVEPEQRVNTVAFPPDGKFLALSFGQGRIRIWDHQQHRPVQTLSGHSRQVVALQYSHDGKLLLSGDLDGGLRLWDVTSGECVKVFNGHVGAIVSAVFSADDQTIVSASNDETIRVWNLPDGDREGAVVGAGRGFAAFSPDCTRVATVNAGRLSICDRDGGRIEHYDTPGGVEPDVCGFFPSGERAFITDKHGGVHVWNVATHERIGTVRHTDGVPAAACSPDGRFLVSGSWDHTCCIWDAADLSLQHTLQHADEVWDLAISHDSRLLASGCRDGTVRLWELQTGRLLHEWHGLGAAVDALAFTPDDRRLAIGCWGSLVKICDVRDSRTLASWQARHGNVYSAAFTPDARRLLLGTSGHVEVWDPACAEMVYSFRAQESSVYALQLSPDTGLLLTASFDTSFRIWPAIPVAATQPAGGALE